MKQIAKILHLLACTNNHSGSMEETNCCWYIEEQMIEAERWEEPDHVKWSGYARIFFEHFEEDEEKCMRVLSSILEITSRLAFVMKNSKGIEEIIIMILNKTLTC